MTEGSFPSAAAILTGVFLVTTQRGCAHSCHDDLSLSINVDTQTTDAHSYDVALTSGDHQIIYHCIMQQGAADAGLKYQLIPEGAAPVVGRSYCGSTEFDLMSETDSEAQALFKAIGGLNFTLTVTSEGAVVVDRPNQSFATEKCDG